MGMSLSVDACSLKTCLRCTAVVSKVVRSPCRVGTYCCGLCGLCCGLFSGVVRASELLSLLRCQIAYLGYPPAQNYYEVLGLSSTATLEEIIDAYNRKLFELGAIINNGDNSPEDVAQARSFQSFIYRVYGILINPAARDDYDARLRFFEERRGTPHQHRM